MPHYLTTTWRDLLREIIRNQDERKRIASVVQVNPETLRRWAASDTNPHWNEIRALLAAVPDLAPLLLQDLLGADAPPDLPSRMSETHEAEAVPRVLQESEEDAHLPAGLYADVLQAVREKAGGRFLAVCRRVIPHALASLDPQRLGMEVALASCMPPGGREEKVCSLIQCLSQGNPPWEPHLQMEPTLFLGAESFAGYVVSRQHWMVTPNVAEHDHLLPLKHSPHEVSVAVFPITRGECIAGCLILSSTQAEYFSPMRLNLISEYVDLLCLAFHDTEFFHPSHIELRTMPGWEVQRKHFSTFRKRVAEVEIESRSLGQSIATSEAEFLVRKFIERELLETLSGQKGAAMPIPNKK
jgi:hypothetical protein